MSFGQEPKFLTRQVVDAIHEDQINTFGGLHGVRDENALESAIAAAQNVYHYGGGDMYEVAAAYAWHLAESQAYFDGNKRTGVEAAFVFLEGSGLDTSGIPEQTTYDLMIKIAAHKAGRGDFAAYLRSELTREQTPDLRALMNEGELQRESEQAKKQEQDQENGNEGPLREGSRKP